MQSLKEYYEKTVHPELGKELGIKNLLAVPRVEKVIVNVGIGTYITQNGDHEPVVETLTAITGQKPVIRKAKIAVSNFNKLRVGEPNGVMVTLRRDQMYDFLGKLVHIVLPRIRDFRGIRESSFDGTGNYSIGILDHTVFPEAVVSDAVKPHGIQITIITSAKDDKEGLLLLKKLGFPFKKKRKPTQKTEGKAGEEKPSEISNE